MDDDRKPLLQDQIAGWRRVGTWEASQNFARVFAITNTILVVWGAVLNDMADFKAAFWTAALMGLGFSLISMMLKITPVFKK